MSSKVTAKVDFHKDNGPNEPSDDIYCLVNPEGYAKWQNDKSVPLVDVVELFHIYKEHSGQPDKISADEMARILGTKDENLAITKILEEGKIEEHKAFSLPNAVLNK